MSLSDENKQKRNKPCENCRAHRRKCKITQGVQCDRCIKMNLTCVFKFTAKPTVIKKSVPLSKKNKMLEQVQTMEQELEDIENQLKALNVKMKQEQPEKNEPGPLKKIKLEPQEWQLILKQNSDHLTFQTSIKSIADIYSFFSNTFCYFNETPLHSPNYFIDRNKQHVIVTNKRLQIESILYSFFQKKQDAKKRLTFYQQDWHARAKFKDQMIQAYFSCGGLISPIFSKPYFEPRFRAQPNSMIASAIAAFVAYTDCRHVCEIPASITRESLAESFRQEAKDMLQDTLLEEEPSILTAGALMLLGQCAMITLENKEARLYINMAWRIIIELKDSFLPIIHRITPTTPITDEIAMAELFRRMFYIVRYLEISLCVIYDQLSDFSSILYDPGIGLPVILENERDDVNVSNAIGVFQHVVMLRICQMPNQSDQMKYQLFAGSLESISIADIEQLENQLFYFWKSLPAEYRLSNAPLEYLQIDHIQQCNNPYAIYLNLLYYCYWLVLEARLMKKPSSTDSTSANVGRFDGERALIIVSVCCDAIAKASQVLNCRLPCILELHWLLIAGDAMVLLKKSKNPDIRNRAVANLKVTLGILEQRMKHCTNTSDSYTWIPTTCSPRPTISSCSSSTVDSEEECHSNEDGTVLTSPNAAYFGEFKKTLYTYFANSN